MGITGLLPHIKPILTTTNIKIYKNKKIAIDGHSWLYQLSQNIAEDVFYNIPTKKLNNLVLNKINLLRSYNIKPIFVFDGEPLLSKKITNDLRKAKKEKIKSQIMELLTYNVGRAKELMKQCVSINEEMLSEIISMLKREKIEYIISPYESDAQLTYLQKTGYVDYVMTEDSDLIVFGCDKMLYKFDGTTVHEFNRSKLIKHDDFLNKYIKEICILSGCDYLPSVKGIGLISAIKLIKKHQCYKKAILEIGIKKVVPKDYENEFQRALITFEEQIVFDPISKTRIHLSGKTKVNNDYYIFLGRIDKENVLEFSKGDHLFVKNKVEEKEIPVRGIEEELNQIIKDNRKGDVLLSNKDKSSILFKKANKKVIIDKPEKKFKTDDSKRRETEKKKKNIIIDEDEYSPFFK